MKKLSDTYKDLGIDFTFPIEIKDANGNKTYYENSNGYWYKYEYNADGMETYFDTSCGFWFKSEYDADGNETYCESSDGYWRMREYDSNGNETYFENSIGCKKGTPRSQPIETLVTNYGEDLEAERQEYELHEWWNSLSEAERERENVELLKDKERLDWLQSSDLTLHSWEEGDVWGSKGVWTIREFIDEKIKEDL